MVLSPAEIIAQQGSSPNWLLALLGRIMTTTASARTKASVLPITLEMRVNDLRTTSFLLMDAKALAASGFEGRVSPPHSASTTRSDAPAWPLPGAVLPQAS